MEDRMYFNIIESVGTTEKPLPPYPNGSATVPSGFYRYVYAIVVTSTLTSPATLSIRIYKGATLEKEVTINVPAGSIVQIMGERDRPVLVIPPDRTLRAVSSANSLGVLMSAYDG